MTLNRHQVVTFNDGEPLDPVKLNKLAQNIDTLYQMTSLANQTNEDGNLAVPVIFTMFHRFEDVKPGQMKEKTFNFGDKFTKEEIDAGKVYAVASLRSALNKEDNITVSISGIKSTPTIYVVNNGKDTRKTIAVDVIAIVMREVSAG